MKRSGPRERVRRTDGPLTAFGASLAQRRRVLGLTQSDLADLADVGVSSIRTLEAGHTSPTLAITLRILDALGLTLVSLTPTDARALTGGGDSLAVELRVDESGVR